MRGLVPSLPPDVSFADQTIGFINSYKPLFKFDDSNQNNVFVPITTRTDRYGMNHVVVEQRFKGIPVYGASMTAHYGKDGSLTSINSSLLPNIPDLSVQPSITVTQTVEVAKQYLQEHQIPVEDDIDIANLKQQLYIYNQGLFSGQQEPTHLVRSFALSGKLFFIDARDGSIVHVLENVLTAKARETYVMADCTDTAGTLTYDESGLVDGVSDDSQALTAHEYAGIVYDYYNQTVFGRDSYDGRGSVLVSRTHYIPDDACGSPYVNAEWDPTENVMKYGENYLALDIAGHEMTHGAIQYSVGVTDTDTLTYEDESGALNESYADIFGEFIELENGGEGEWLIGEDLLSGTLRDMTNPSNYDQPSHVEGMLYGDDVPCSTTSDATNGCVHFNSGITNNALYLLVNGGANPYSGLTVDNPIGRAAAEAIYYQVLTGGYLNTNATFEDAYLATFQACQELNQTDPATYPFSYCESVYDAFQAVGITSTTTFLHVDIQATPTEGYAPLTVDFDGAASQSFGGTITDYEWDLDSSVDSDSNGSVVDDVDNTGPVAASTYDDPKTLNARLTITDNTGNFSHDSATITVNDPLEPTFSMSGDGVTAPTTVSFDASGTMVYTGTITDYTWDFGDGVTESSGTSATTSHEYTSDGYYTVTLTITTDTGYSETYSHMVLIGSTASGGSGATEVEGTINNDTWTVARSPYVVSGSVTVASGYTLTIEPGTVIKFGSSSALTVSGTLDAQGTSSDQIVFTSYKDDTYGGDTNGDGSTTTADAGDWGWIRVSSGATASLDYVTIQYGGFSSMLLIDDNAANVSINHSILQYSEYYTMQVDPGSTSIIQNSIITNAEVSTAVYIAGGTSTFTNNTISSNSCGLSISNASSTITGNTFTNSSYGLCVSSSASVIRDNTFTGNIYPVKLSSMVAGMTLTGNSGSGNTYNAIVLSGSTSDNFSINADNDLPYAFGNFTVNAGTTLTIPPGLTVKFVNSYALLVVSGTIDAQGTNTNPIAFTSYQDDIFGGDTNGDGSATTPAVGDWRYFQIASGGTANLDYVTMQYGGSSSSSPMLLIDDNATNVSINHSTLQYSDEDTIEIDSGSTSTISDSIIANTEGYDAVYITGGTSTFTDNTINAVGSGFAVYVSNASPTLTNNTMTGGTSEFYVTGGIYITGSSSTPNITGNTITGNGYGIYVTSSANPIVANNTFTENTNGIYVTGSSAPTVTDNTFTENIYPISLDTVTSGMTLTGNTGSGNTYDAILLSGETAGDFTLNMANDLPYVFENFTVSSSNTLTINQGMVVKFLDTSSYVTVSGTLDAVGTSTAPIVFTSYKDDANGGDANNDGSATSPSAGDWYYMNIASSGRATLDYVTMQYGGYTGNSIDYAMLLIDDNAASVSVDHSTLQSSRYYTLEIDPGSTSTIQNSTITNGVDQFATYITGGTSTFTGNTINAVGSGYAVLVSNASPILTNNTMTGSFYGISITGSSSPTITDNTISGNDYGIRTSSIANPVVTNNRIYDNTSSGLYNDTSSITINAKNNWWGDTSGPYNFVSNPTGIGDAVSRFVDFNPWLTADPTADTTPPSEVTLGTVRKDVWAPSVTVNWTNPTDTDFDHVQIDRTVVTTGTATTLSSTETGTSYVDTTTSYNTNYTYTLSACDTTGNCSSGVTTASQRVRNPTPTGLTLTAGNTTIAATWTASSAPTTTLGGYMVYYGTSPTALTSVVDVGNVTSTTLTGLTNGTRYYVAVSAYSRVEVESALTTVKSTRPHP
ncbi:MAG: right-handed parallel beta-helix repeat-containing protein [Candidatus Kerfeldbacteria bacterium]|nr:right-handed parallel beta-helix repeat-containing protein [Candidatus Kerfeldbacteria bacterium]